MSDLLTTRNRVPHPSHPFFSQTSCRTYTRGKWRLSSGADDATFATSHICLLVLVLLLRMLLVLWASQVDPESDILTTGQVPYFPLFFYIHSTKQFVFVISTLT